MGNYHHVRLFRTGRSQAVRIPREFEFSENEIMIRKDGDRLILEPVKKQKNLLALLASLEPIEDAFPDVDEGLSTLNGIEF